ncbi:MAG: Maf family nucleotide pyrophosphatase [Rudaea sp.]
MPEKTTKNRLRPLVLASTSPYRRELLARLRLRFDVEAPGVDETPLPGEPPAATPCRLAEAKARAVAARRGDALVIGADQVADAGGVVFSKPVDHADAVTQLTRLAGQSVVFHTAVALVDAASGRCAVRLVDVTTTFRALERRAIENYLRRERPYDCAASIKSEGLGIALVESITSDDPTALIGLPLIALVGLLRAEGVDVLAGGGTVRGSAAPGPVAE